MMTARLFRSPVRGGHELQEKTSYILMNPVRKGLCERAEDWMWVIIRTPACRRCLARDLRHATDCRVVVADSFVAKYPRTGMHVQHLE